MGNFDFGKYLKSRRKAFGLTQRQVAQRMGVSTQAYARYEQSETTPKLGTLVRISEALGLSLYDLGLSLKDLDGETANYLLERLLPYDADHEEKVQYIKLLDHFKDLNDVGREKVLDCASDLLCIEKYKREEFIKIQEALETIERKRQGSKPTFSAFEDAEINPGPK